MPVSYMTEVRRRAGRLLGLHSITSSARASSLRRHDEAQPLRSFQIDDKLELGRLLNGKIGGVGSF
jgi:hypothetical protein